MSAYILAIDQGTTSTRSVIFAENGDIVSAVSRRHGQIYENPAWVEHNADEIYFNAAETAKQALSAAGLSASDVCAIGITNQRETTIAWDKDTGEPVHNAIVWQDKRTADVCERIKQDGFESVIRAKTGLVADPYFSATKMRWLMENVESVRHLAQKGRLLFGTIDAFLIYKLTRGKRHITDFTNASRTMLFNIHTPDWDDELLKYFGISRECLPQIVPSSGVSAYTDKSVFGAEIPIAGIAGDQHAALFGQGCFGRGDAKNTYGTGCFILQNIGGEPPKKPIDGLLSTIGYNVEGKTVYAVEGSIFSAGSAIEWLINNLKILSDVGELEYILSSVKTSNGVTFVPAFSGLGAPHWDSSARAAFYGLTLASRREEIIRAVCESIAFSVNDALAYIENNTGVKIPALSVDGGVSNNNALMGFQAFVSNKPVRRPKNIETTALGAAAFAGLAVGVYKNLDALRTLKGEETVFAPQSDENYRAALLSAWADAVRRTKNTR